MNRLELIEGEAWRELVAAPIAVLVPSRSTCPLCKAWSEELTAFLEGDQRWRHVRFGEIFIYDDGQRVAGADDDDDDDDGGAFGAMARALSSEIAAAAGPQGSFADANRDWLGEVQDLPYNVLYVGGQRVKAWPGAGIERLLTRLEGIAAR